MLATAARASNLQLQGHTDSQRPHWTGEVTSVNKTIIMALEKVKNSISSTGILSADTLTKVMGVTA